MFFLTFFRRLMPHVTLLYLAMQSKDLNANSARKALDEFRKQVQVSRDKVREVVQNLSADFAINRRTKSDQQLIAAASRVCDIIGVEANELFTFNGHLIASQLVNPSRIKDF